MIPLTYEKPADLAAAVKATVPDRAMPLGGGTNLVDLMKLNVLTPSKVVYVKPLLDDAVAMDGDTLRIGAGCTMSRLADHERVREKFPALRQSLILAASPQIRNMATLGGNLLQRSRNPYYRHVDLPTDAAAPGDDGRAFGAGADTSLMAVLGHGGRLCGTYPGDFAVALLAFDGTVHLQGPDGERDVKARKFYQLPDGDNHYRTVIKPGELIVALSLPESPTWSRSMYMKVRERSSYAFALASAAVGIVLDGDTVKQARVALGGVGTVPWHSPVAESALEGKKATDDTFAAAAEAALADAQPPAGTEYKVKLAQRVLVRTLQHLRDHGAPGDAEVWAMQHGR